MYRVFKDSQITYDINKPYFLTIVSRNDNNDDDVLENNTIQKEEKEANKNMLNNHITQKVLELKTKEANRILIKAKNESKKIIKNAQIASENIMRSREQEGYAKGIEKANAEYLKAVKELENWKKNLEAEHEKKIRVIEEQILDLSLILARKIIDIEIDKNDAAVLSALQSVMSKVQAEHNITVEMSADNVRKIDSLVPHHKYKLKENNEFSNSDIILNSESGIIDASFDVQFENLKKSLYKMSKIV